MGQGEKRRLDYKCNEKLLGSWKHKRDMIPFMFSKDDPGCCAVTGLSWDKHESEESSQEATVVIQVSSVAA